MPFWAWMEACLYDPDEGYYMRPGRKTGAGDDADFATSPTLHPFLAQCVAKEVVEAWEALGRPAGFAVYEFGGGEGHLARDALAWLDAHSDLSPTWHHVERSPMHRAAQEDGRVVHVEGLPRGAVGLVVAHEFLDALPFSWLEARKGDWAEVHVMSAGDRFEETLSLPCREAIEAAPRGTFPEGQRVAAMWAARDWVRRVGRELAAGRVLVVDYGGRDVWRRGPDGTVRTFRGQQDAGSPFEDPGDKDITASVDFPLVQAWAEGAGLEVLWEESQEAFLVRHGALEALNAQDRDSLEGASSYLRLRQMIIPHAGGMGAAFRVQCLQKRAG